MFSIVVLSNQEPLARAVEAALLSSEYHVTALPHGGGQIEEVTQRPPELLIFDHGDGSHRDEWRSFGVGSAARAVAGHTALVAIIRPEQAALLEDQPPADDFLIWPVSSIELLLRVRQLLRRLAKVDAEDMLRCGDLHIDLGNYKVSLQGRPIELTYKEYELLRFLASNRDRVYTREALLNRVWGYDYFGGARTVDVHIRRLRSKIEGRGHSFIETIRNVGYRFHESSGTGSRQLDREVIAESGPERCP